MALNGFQWLRMAFNESQNRIFLLPFSGAWTNTFLNQEVINSEIGVKNCKVFSEINTVGTN